MYHSKTWQMVVLKTKQMVCFIKIIVLSLAFLAGCAFLSFLVKKKVDSAKKLLAPRNYATSHSEDGVEMEEEQGNHNSKST
jgi:hypothetical protein